MISKIKYTKISFMLLALFVMTLIDYLFASEYKDREYNVDRMYSHIGNGLLLLFALSVSIKNIGRILSNKYMVPVLLLLFVNSIYFFLDNILFEFGVYEFSLYMKSVFWVILLYFFYYTIEENYALNIKFIKIFVICMILLQVLTVVKGYYYYDKDFVYVSNNGYAVLSFLPLVFFLYNNKNVKYLLFVLIVVGVFFSMKRGAILGLLLSIPFILLYELPKLSMIKKIFLLLFFLVLMMGIYNYLGDYLFLRYEEMISDSSGRGIGSGRSIFFNIIFNEWYGTDFFGKIFGHGYLSVTKLLENKFGMNIYAHNDLLEIMYDYGLLGMIVYFFYFRSLMFVFYETKIFIEQKYLYAVFFFSFMSNSLFSSVMYNNQNYVYMIYLSLLFVQMKRYINCSVGNIGGNHEKVS